MSCLFTLCKPWITHFEVSYSAVLDVRTLSQLKHNNTIPLKLGEWHCFYPLVMKISTTIWFHYKHIWFHYKHPFTQNCKAQNSLKFCFQVSIFLEEKNMNWLNALQNSGKAFQYKKTSTTKLKQTPLLKKPPVIILKNFVIFCVCF